MIFVLRDLSYCDTPEFGFLLSHAFTRSHRSEAAERATEALGYLTRLGVALYTWEGRYKEVDLHDHGSYIVSRRGLTINLPKNEMPAISTAGTVDLPLQSFGGYTAISICCPY